MTATKKRTGDRLVAADRVQGTEVFSKSGDRLGEVKTIFIDKTSGKAEFVALAYGGMLGVGRHYHPVPWSALTYDPDRHGFVVDLDRETLDAAPAYDDEALGRQGEWNDKVRGYYAEHGVMMM